MTIHQNPASSDKCMWMADAIQRIHVPVNPKAPPGSKTFVLVGLWANHAHTIVALGKHQCPNRKQMLVLMYLVWFS